MLHMTDAEPVKHIIDHPRSAVVRLYTFGDECMSVFNAITFYQPF